MADNEEQARNLGLGTTRAPTLLSIQPDGGLNFPLFRSFLYADKKMNKRKPPRSLGRPS
jgi:hypothetical protein